MVANRHDGRAMTKYETYTYKGKEHKFRVDKKEPKLEMFQLRSSDYYKEKRKNLSFVKFVSAYPILAAVAVFMFAVFGLDGWGLLVLFMFPYFFLVYEADSKAGKVEDVLLDLKKKAENEEYMEAYRAWMKDRTE